ncbi:MAG: DUF433 domain-containing protein [Chloroflexi bacterium]|nr:DUF433 domain-containing protein [Chloroflexota bacterium]MBU1750543.1 DUF433 domain-containing protein [Chloroflexota bacterium]MBU1878077.1 DUF433 domain-containing protein [Chloroflexota bacterium]
MAKVQDWKTATSDELIQISSAVWLDQDTPVIAGTRVPVHFAISCLTYEEGGITAFLENYPWIRREQVEAAINWVVENLEHLASASVPSYEAVA